MIDFLSLKAVNDRYMDQIQTAVKRVLRSGRYLWGPELEAFEKEYAEFTGTAHAVGCANGLDALTLIFKAYMELGRLKPGDGVIVPANTFIATILAITECGLEAQLVEPSEETLEIDETLLERSVTPTTKAVCLVHLYGRLAYSDKIARICADHNLLLVEDNAQAHGCTLPDGRRTGSLGHAAAHSFYPGKNLGGMGDGGAVTTSDGELATLVRELGNYGSVRKYQFDYCGMNSRLDELQAAVLRVRLAHLESDNSLRRHVASLYYNGIRNSEVRLPSWCGSHVFHIFPILCKQRDALKAYLEQNGVSVLIHYPIPPHLQKCYKQTFHVSLPVTERLASQELSLPMGPVISDSEVLRVVELVNSFKNS